MKTDLIVFAWANQMWWLFYTVTQLVPALSMYIGFITGVVLTVSVILIGVFEQEVKDGFCDLLRI